MKEYLILANINDDTPNTSVLYRDYNFLEVKDIYNKLLRFQDLEFPESQSLLDERIELFEELSGLGISFLNNEETINIGDIEVSILGIYETNNVITLEKESEFCVKEEI